MRDARERLRDILEAISAIERYLDRGKAEFKQNELLQVWFVRNLQIIGEAARGLPADIRSLAPEVAWPKIIGMRNVLVHGYFELDTEIIWETASRDVIELKLPMAQLLQSLETGS